MPTYSIRSGRFVARERAKCKNCSFTPYEAGNKKPQKLPSTFWVPVNGMISFVLDNGLGREPGDNYPSKPRWMRRAAAAAKKKAADENGKRDAAAKKETTAAAIVVAGGETSSKDEAAVVPVALLVSKGV